MRAETPKNSESSTCLSTVICNTLYWSAVGSNWLSVSRNAIGAYQFTKRIWPSSTAWQLLIPGSVLGIIASYSPFLQCRNSIEKICKQLKEEKNGIRNFMLSLPIGVAAALSFAEMSYDALQALIPYLPYGELVPQGTVTALAKGIFAISVYAYSIMYAQKVGNVEFKKIISAIKQHPLHSIPLLINLAGACLGVATNYQFGEQLFTRFWENQICAKLFAGFSAGGPAAMSFVDTSLMAEKIVESYTPKTKNKSQDRNDDDKSTHLLITINGTNHTPKIISDPANESDHFSFSSIDLCLILKNFIMACFSAIPNTEYNLNVNFKEFSIWGLFLLIIGIIYNVIPKFIGSLETVTREEKKREAERPKLVYYEVNSPRTPKFTKNYRLVPPRSATEPTFSSTTTPGAAFSYPSSSFSS